jgi:hypothetical protein
MLFFLNLLRINNLTKGTLVCVYLQLDEIVVYYYNAPRGACHGGPFMTYEWGG